MRIFKCTIPFLLVLLCSSCNENKKEIKEEGNLGEFVYIDKSGCLHAKKVCVNLFDYDETKDRNYQVQFVKTKTLTSDVFNSFCSDCVKDEDFTKIQSIVKMNDSYRTEDYSDSTEVI